MDSKNSSEPLIDDIGSILREWYDITPQQILLGRRYRDFDTITKLCDQLDRARKQLIIGNLSKSELKDVRKSSELAIDQGNKILSGDMIVRSEERRGAVMNGEDSPCDISAAQAMMATLQEEPKTAVAAKDSLHHLLVDVKHFTNASKEPTTLVIYLITRNKASVSIDRLTESYEVPLNAQGSLESLHVKFRTAALFGNFTPTDIGKTAAADTETSLVIEARRMFVPIPLNSMGGRNSASVSMDSLALSTPFNATHKETILRENKGSTRLSMIGDTFKGSVKNAFKSPSKKSPAKAPYGMIPLQETFESPSTGEPRLSTTSSMTPPGTPGKPFYRLVAVGVVNVTKLMQQDNEVDTEVQLWTPSLAPNPNPQNKGEDWHEIIRDLLPSKKGSYDRTSTLPKVQIGLKPYVGDDAATLISTKPTELSGVTLIPKIGFSGAPTKPRNDVYLTIERATLPDKAVLSRANGGNTGFSPRSDLNSVYVKLEVRGHKGATITNAIQSCSNSQPTSAYETTVVGRNEAWNETIRVNISPEDIRGAHLHMSLYDAPHSAVAVSHLPLWHENAFVRDGNHDLLLYKMEEGMSGPLPDANRRGGYLTVNYEAKRNGVSRDEALTGPLSTLRVKTYLCSTRMSQDKIILGLLNWKSQKQADVAHNLKQLLFIPEIEIVKQLNEVFDSLFSIIVQHSENETFEDLGFMAIVHVLAIVHDRRYNKTLGPLVDKYAEERFNFPSATPCLIETFVRLLVATDGPSANKLNKTLKVTNLMLKFIVKGRSQQMEKQADIGITNGPAGFGTDLNAFFKALNNLMQSKETVLVGSKALAAHNFVSWLPELTPILSTERIVEQAVDFVDAMTDARGQLILHKNLILIHLASLDLFSKEKGALLHNTPRWLAGHWGAIDNGFSMSAQYRDQVRLCCTVMHTQMEDLDDSNLQNQHLPNIIDSYLKLLSMPKLERKGTLSPLFPRTYPFPVKPTDGETGYFDEALVELAAVLAAFSESEHGLQLDRIAPNNEDLAELIHKLLKVIESILKAEAFPKAWLSTFVYHHKSALHTLDQVGVLLLNEMKPNDEELVNGALFLDQLYKLWFNTLFKVLTSDALTIETFAQQKRRAVWNIGGDVRKEGANLLYKIWYELGWPTVEDERERFGLERMGGFQVQFGDLIPHVLELCMHVHEDLQRTGLEIIKSMICSELQLEESVNGIQDRMIVALEGLFATKKLVDVRDEWLYDLNREFQVDPKKEEIEQMLGKIQDLVELLQAVYVDNVDEADQLINRLELMEFFKDLGKTDTFVKYVHQLADVLAAAGNFTEAGLAIKKHAELYDWNDSEILEAEKELSLPAQTMAERKEELYKKMVERFEQGQSWGSALVCYEELAAYYREHIFHFGKLAKTQVCIGACYEEIAKPERLLTKFFHVALGGFGYSDFQKKDDIHESKPGEDFGPFSDRLKEMFPDARMVDDISGYEDVEGKYFQIRPAYPLLALQEDWLKRAKIPAQVKDYQMTRNCKQFWTWSEKDTSGPIDEHSSTKFVFFVEDAFPTISRRSEVTQTCEVFLDAIETSIERVLMVTRRIAAREKSWVSKNDDLSLNALVKAMKFELDPQLSAVVHTRALVPLPQQDEEVVLDVHQQVLKTALIDLAVAIHRVLSKLEQSDDSITRASAVSLRGQFEKTFTPEVDFIAPKVVEMADQTQMSSDFSLSILTSADFLHYNKSKEKDNRQSNHSILGPLVSMQKKCTQPSMKSSHSSQDNESVNTKSSKGLGARVSHFFGGGGNKQDSSIEVSSMIGHSSAMKTKRGPPVTMKNVGNTKGLNRHQSDAGSTKSSRRSLDFGSIKESFGFARGRSNSNATHQTQQAITDDGNSDWVSESTNYGRGNKRFASDSTNNDSLNFTDGGQFVNRSRYISDSIMRGASTQASIAPAYQASIIASNSQYSIYSYPALSSTRDLANTMLQGRGSAGGFESGFVIGEVGGDDDEEDLHGPVMGNAYLRDLVYGRHGSSQSNDSQIGGDESDIDGQALEDDESDIDGPIMEEDESDIDGPTTENDESHMKGQDFDLQDSEVINDSQTYVRGAKKTSYLAEESPDLAVIAGEAEQDAAFERESQSIYESLRSPVKVAAPPAFDINALIRERGGLGLGIFEPMIAQVSASESFPVNSPVHEPPRRVSIFASIFDCMRPARVTPTRVKTDSSRNFVGGEREVPVEVEREIGALYDARDGVRMIMTEDGAVTFEAWCEQDDRDQDEARHDAMVKDVIRGCRELNFPHLIFNELAGDTWQEKVRAYNEYRNMIHARCGLDPLIEFRKPKWARAPYLPHVELADGTEFKDAWDGTKMIMHEEGPLTLQQWDDYQKHLERGRELAVAWAMKGRSDAAPPTRRGSPSMGSPVVDNPMAQNMDPQEAQSFSSSYGPGMHNEAYGGEFYHNNGHVDEESFEQYATSSPFIRHALSSDDEDGYPKIPPPSPPMDPAQEQEANSSPQNGHPLESDDEVPSSTNSPPGKTLLSAQVPRRSEWSSSPPPPAVKSDDVKCMRPSTSWFAKHSGPQAPRKPSRNVESPLIGYATYHGPPPMMGQLRLELSVIDEFPQQEIIYQAQTYHGAGYQQEDAQDHGFGNNLSSQIRDAIEAQAERNANQRREQERQQFEQELEEDRQQHELLLMLSKRQQEQARQHQMGPKDSSFFDAPSVSSASQDPGSSPPLRHGNQFLSRPLDPGYVPPAAGADSPGYGDMFAPPQMQSIPLGNTAGDIKAPIYQGLGIDFQRQVFEGPAPGFQEQVQSSMGPPPGFFGYGQAQAPPQQGRTSIQYASGVCSYNGSAQQPAGYGSMGLPPQHAPMGYGSMGLPQPQQGFQQSQPSMGFSQGIFSYGTVRPSPIGYGSMGPSPPGFAYANAHQHAAMGYSSMRPPPGQRGYSSLAQVPGLEPYAPFLGVDSAQQAPMAYGSMRPPPGFARSYNAQQTPLGYGPIGPPPQQAPPGYASIRPPSGLGCENAYVRPPPPPMTTEQAYMVSPAHGYATMRPQMMQPSQRESGYATFGGYGSRASLSSSQFSADVGVGLSLNLGEEEEEEEEEET